MNQPGLGEVAGLEFPELNTSDIDAPVRIGAGAGAGADRSTGSAVTS